MKKTALMALAAALAMPAFAEDPAVKADTAFVFTDVVTIPDTSVKDQNKSGTCWCFSGTSFFEDEILRQGGDSLDISEMYTVRKCYEDKAERFIRLYGQTNFAAGGSAMDVPYVWKKYGAIPEEVYSGLQYGENKHVHGELDAALSAYLKAVVAKPNKKLTTSWRKGVQGILDAYFGEYPRHSPTRAKHTLPRVLRPLSLSMSTTMCP